jgi:receptor protein-tyrosine kinase
VIVDSAPLLAVTDGAILATVADGALIIAKYGETKREQMAHAVGTLRDVGASLLGAVLTLVPLRGTGTYSYSYSYSYYGQNDRNVSSAEPSPHPDADDANSELSSGYEAGEHQAKQ